MDYNVIRNAWGADAKETYSTPLDKLPMKKNLDKFRGCLIGGAVGDALGYAIEFLSESFIFAKFGKEGIRDYLLHDGKAWISDDTQMTMFTANGLLSGTTRGCTRGIMGTYPSYIAGAYLDWYKTQFESYAHCNREFITSWLMNVPELFVPRAPGNTCLSAIYAGCYGSVEKPINASKGCGGVMRVAPIGLYFGDSRMAPLAIDLMGADVAALTHGHEMGYIPAAMLTLKDIDYEAVVKMVYPTLLRKISGTPSRNLLVRLIRELGEDGEKVLVALMEKLPQDAKNQLVCHCLNSYGTTLVGKLNEYLQEDTWGKAFVLDSFTAELDDGSLALTARNVQVDFKAILMEASKSKNLEKIAGRVVGNGLLGAFAAKAAAKVAEQAAQATEAMTPEELEAAGVALLNKDSVQKKLMDVIANALTKKNIPLAVEEISVESFDLVVLPDEDAQSLLNLPEELEDALIKALADFLREME